MARSPCACDVERLGVMPWNVMPGATAAARNSGAWSATNLFIVPAGPPNSSRAADVARLTVEQRQAHHAAFAGELWQVFLAAPQHEVVCVDYVAKRDARQPRVRVVGAMRAGRFFPRPG